MVTAQSYKSESWLVSKGCSLICKAGTRNATPLPEIDSWEGRNFANCQVLSDVSIAFCCLPLRTVVDICCHFWPPRQNPFSLPNNIAEFPWEATLPFSAKWSESILPPAAAGGSWWLQLKDSPHLDGVMWGCGAMGRCTVQSLKIKQALRRWNREMQRIWIFDDIAWAPGYSHAWSLPLNIQVIWANYLPILLTLDFLLFGT